MRPWIVLGTLLFVAILGFGCIEFVQRRRFERLRKEIEELAYSLEGAKLGRAGDAITFLPEGEAQYQGGRGFNLEEQDRWMQWSLTPKSLNNAELGEIWTGARVIFMLRQHRTVFLRSPRVLVIMLRPPQPKIAAHMDSLLQSRGIEYEHVAGLP
jgi:hypothetical protein